MSCSPDSATLMGLSHFLELLQPPQLARGIANRCLNGSKLCTERVFKIRGTIYTDLGSTPSSLNLIENTTASSKYLCT